MKRTEVNVFVIQGHGRGKTALEQKARREVNWIVYEMGNEIKNEIAQNNSKTVFALDGVWIEHLRLASALHNLNFKFNWHVAHDFHALVWWTHRQQHAFDLANRSETSEEGQNTDESWGYDQHIDSSREQVRTQQLTQEVPIDECNESQHKYNCSADL